MFYFTNDQIDEIEKRLAVRAKKDTDFDAVSEAQEGDLVAIIHNGRNMICRLDKLPGRLVAKRYNDIPADITEENILETPTAFSISVLKTLLGIEDMPEFDDDTAYEKGSYVSYTDANGILRGYVFTADKPAGYWDESKVTEINYASLSENIKDILSEFKSGGRVYVLESYFSNGKAKKAIADEDGKNIKQYYALKTDIPDVNREIAEAIAVKLDNTPKGSHEVPIYIALDLQTGYGKSEVIDSLHLPGDIRSDLDIFAGRGVAAYGIADLYLSGRGGSGTLTEIQINGTTIPDINGVVNLPAYPSALSQLTSDTTHRLVTDSQISYWTEKYDLPSGGIPKTDLSSSVRDTLDTADSSAVTLSNLIAGLRSKGAHNLPIYFDGNTDVQEIDSLLVSGNIQSTQGGVSAFGIGSLALGGGGGQGTLTEIQIDGTTIPDVEGIVDLPAYPTWTTLSGRPTLSAVATSGRFIDLTDTPTTLGGYGILDAKINNGVITIGSDSITPIISHQTIYTLTVQKNGVTVDSFNAASANKTINIEDVASLSAFNTFVGHLTSKGSHSRPIYLNGTPEGVEIDSLNVPGNIESTQGGVSAFGIANLTVSGGSGGGTLTQIQINGVALADTDGIVNIIADGTYNISSNKLATQSSIVNALNTLDYTAAGASASKTLSSLTETNGVINATFQDIAIAISQVSGLQSALDNKLSTSLKGAANGLAELDSNGLVPSSQLPSYVDDVLEYPSLSDFPSTGTAGKIYVALDTNLTYRWSGTTYVEISPSLALGETSSTAYRGDRGAVAYSHATDASRLTTAQSAGFYKFSTTSEGHIAGVSSVGWSDITSLDNGTTYAPYNSYGYLPLSGGTSPVNFNSNNLPQFSGSIPYFVGIESFSDGGTLKWAAAADCSVGYANVAGRVGTTTIGSTSLPVYINSGTPTIIDSLTVPGNIQSTSGGVSAFGIASLNVLAGGGSGTLTEIQINGISVPDTSGIVNITALSDTNGQIKIAGQAITINGWQTVSDYSFEGHTAYGWGNHANAGYLLASMAANTYLPLSGGTMSNTNLVTNLNADLLDGREATGFVKKEELPNSGQSYNANSLTNAGTYYTTTGDRRSVQAWENFPDNETSGPFDLVCLKGENSSYPVQFFHNYDKNDFWLRFKSYFNGGPNWKDWAKIWTSANHGSGSGLDADLLDGEHASAFAHVGQWNNLLTAGNEFNFISNGYTGFVWFNYQDGNRQGDANITAYVFGDGRAGSNTILYCGGVYKANYGSSDYVLTSDGGAAAISALSVNYATSAGNADTVDNLHATDLYRDIVDNGNYTDNVIPTDLVAGHHRVHRPGIEYASILAGYDFYGSYWQMYFHPTVNYSQDIQYRASNCTTWKTLLDSNNYNNYSPTLTGTGASGTWGINITGSANYATYAGSATQLQTYRSIWGQSFNGTADVSGAMSGVTSIDSLAYFDTTNSRMGIGTTSPYTAFEVAFSGSGDPDSTSVASTAKIAFNRHNDDGLFMGIGTNSVFWMQSAYYGTSGGTSAGHCYPLSLNPLGGNVGIGTTSPSYKLHVAGDIYANGGLLRTSGAAGWYSETYGGGWYCDDYTYVKTYGSRSIYTANNVLAGGNIVANGGVAAGGIVSMSMSGSGAAGAVTQINVGSTPYTPTDGIVDLPAYPVVSWANLSGTAPGVSTFSNDMGYQKAITTTSTTLDAGGGTLQVNVTEANETVQYCEFSPTASGKTFTMKFTAPSGGTIQYGYRRMIVVTNGGSQSANVYFTFRTYTFIPVSFMNGFSLNPTESAYITLIQTSASKYDIVKVEKEIIIND